MTGSKIQTATGLSTIALTKFIMKKYGVNQEEAYRKLLSMELYELLNDAETGLYLEDNSYLCEACDIELEFGKDRMCDFISQM